MAGKIVLGRTRHISFLVRPLLLLLSNMGNEILSGIKLRLIWAVGLFDLGSVSHRGLIKTLKNLAQNREVEVQLVYVLSGADLDLPLNSSEFYLREFEEQIKKEFEGGGPKLIPCRVISQSDRLLTEGTVLLDEYAKQMDCSFILVNIEERKGLRSLTLGSFTESLLAEAQTPVLIFNSQSRALSDEKLNILFPTDYGPTSEVAFRKVLQWTSDLNARVGVFHKIEKIMGLFPKKNTRDLSPVQKRFEADAQRLHRELSFITISSRTRLSRLIMENAQALNFNLVVVSLFQGPGRVAREIVRGSSIPVLSINLSDQLMVQEAMIGIPSGVDYTVLASD